MKSHDVLNTHIRLVEAMNRPGLRGYLQHLTRHERLSKVITIEDFVIHGLLQSETLWPTVELVDKIIDTAEAYPVDVPVAGYQLPEVPFGVAVLDKPLATVDSLGREELTHVVTWSLLMIQDADLPSDAPPVRSFHAIMWNDARRKPDGGASEQMALWRKEGGRARAEEINHLFPIRSFTFALDRTLIGPMWTPVPDKQRERDEAEGYHPPALAINTGRCLLALFELINRAPVPQEGDTGVSVGKSVVRHAQRVKVDPTIRVLPLHTAPSPRRELDPDRPKGTRASVDHRVVVREHKRMQAYGPGRTLRKEITIRSYEYGPQDPPDYTPPPRIYRVG